ncbi:MAG: hypothetical protein A2252_02300 [Elusimicrobia bacterium RIFOXYA2_FULL_39_19]|nr:MAG: hypothetical protein A2252_02300 [Elusimicrobia bacterium RIFOXYA2_FULL_39_19]
MGLIQRRVGVGLIGVGSIGGTHAKEIKAIKEAELIAVADYDKEKVKDFAEKFGIENYYTDYKELLRRSDIEIVNICTPSSTHSNIAIDAANHKKHVITEKPIDITLENADKMIEACKKNDVKLSIIFQLRFADDCIRAKNMIDEGRLGKIILADLYMKFYRPLDYYKKSNWKGTKKGDGGGALMNQGIHGIDLLQWLIGSVKSIQGLTGALRHDIEVEDTAVALLEFKNGAFGVIEGTTSVYPDLSQKIEIHGTNGTLILKGGEWPTIEFCEFLDKKEVCELKKYPSEDEMWGVAHRSQIMDMISAVRENREPIINGLEGRKSLEIVLGIYKSSERGRMVEL